MEAGGCFFCFYFPKVITLAKKGRRGASPLILLKARLWLTMPDDEPPVRDCTHCPKTGTNTFGGRITHQFKRMLD